MSIYDNPKKNYPTGLFLVPKTLNVAIIELLNDPRGGH